MVDDELVGLLYVVVGVRAQATGGVRVIVGRGEGEDKVVGLHHEAGVGLVARAEVGFCNV